MVKRPTALHTGSTTALYRYHRKIGAVAACLILMSLLVGCMEQGETSGVKSRANDKVLRFDCPWAFTSFFPADTKASGSTLVYPLLYSYLFVPDPKGVLQPDLAEDWDYTPNKRQWTIHLRQDARFHDNRPVTARDVAFSLDIYINQKRVEFKNLISRIEALSNHTIAIRLKKDDPRTLHKLWDIEIVPRPQNGKIEDGNPPVGSGPFRFAHRQGHERVTLEANANYYGGKPALDRVVFYYQPDREKSWTRLLSGTTDIAKEITPENYQITLRSQDRYYFYTHTMSHYTILLYNTHDPLFSDPTVRTALTMGIDRNYIVRIILNGFGKVAAGPMGLDSPYHDPDVTPLPFDPDRAKDLLYRAGWRPDKQGRLQKNDELFAFTLFVFQESDIDKRVARFIQLCLHQLGITVAVQPLNYKENIESYLQNTQFQAVLTELDGAYRLSNISRIWIPAAHGKAYAGDFNHPKVNLLMAEISTEESPANYQSLMRKADGLIHSLQPGTFLFHKTLLDVMSRRINLPSASTFSLTHEGLFRLKDVSIR